MDEDIYGVPKVRRVTITVEWAHGATSEIVADEPAAFEPHITERRDMNVWPLRPLGFLDEAVELTLRIVPGDKPMRLTEPGGITSMHDIATPGVYGCEIPDLVDVRGRYVLEPTGEGGVRARKVDG